MKKKTYLYEGPVFHFNVCIEKRYLALTTAVSEKQARNNLAFRYRTENGYERTFRITLPGKIESVSDRRLNERSNEGIISGNKGA